MKKLTTILVALLLVATCAFSLASCQALDTVEVINGAIENTAKLNDFEANVDMTIDMAMSGMTINIPMEMAVKVKDADKENPISWATVSMEMFGEKVETETYMDDEYVYVVADGECYKMEIDMADEEYDYSDELTTSIKKLPVELIQDIELEKAEDGSYTVTVNVPKEFFEETYKELIDSVSEASLGEVIDDLEITDCVVSVTVKDDYVTNYDISFKMSLSIEGMNAAANVSASFEIVNPGQSVTITPPTGYRNFDKIGW